MWCVSYLPGFLRLLFLLFFNIITKWAFKFIYSRSVVIIFIYFAFIHSQYLNIITIISIQIWDVQKWRRNYKVNKSTNLCPWCFIISPVPQRLLFLPKSSAWDFTLMPIVRIAGCLAHSIRPCMYSRFGCRIGTWQRHGNSREGIQRSSFDGEKHKTKI